MLVVAQAPEDREHRQPERDLEELRRVDRHDFRRRERGERVVLIRTSRDERGMVFVAGEYVDCHALSLLRSDWQAMKGKAT